jgi:hypothetical protein
MNVPDEIAVPALTPAARPPITPRRVTFDPIMKCSSLAGGLDSGQVVFAVPVVDDFSR